MCLDPRTVIPRPTIPKQYRHLKDSEMPEPYKTMVRDYINALTRAYQQSCDQAFNQLIRIAIPAILIVVAIVVLIARAS